MKRDISKLKKNTGVHFKIGLIIALSFSLWAFNITTVRDTQNYTGVIDPFEELIENTPITAHKKKKPIPPPPSIESVDKLEPIDDTEFIETPEPEKKETELRPVTDVEPKMVIARPVKVEKKVPVKTPPPILEDDPIEEPDEIHVIVERMPVFTSPCSDGNTEQERRICSDSAIMSFISKNMKYPAIARENGIEGVVVLSFVVDKDGQLIDKKIVKDIGGGCGKEAMRILNKMNDWMPGIQRTNPVKVKFTLPIKFKLKR